MHKDFFLNLYFFDLSGTDPGEAFELVRGTLSPVRLEICLKKRQAIDRLRSASCEILLKYALTELGYTGKPQVMPGDLIYEAIVPVSGERGMSVKGFKFDQNALNTGADIPELHYGYGEKGKPYLLGESLKGVHFNFSHSGDIALCVVSSEEVGCDIQKIQDAPVKVAERFFAPGERSVFQSMETEAERDELFFRIWSGKESYIKLTGKGLTMELADFDIFDTDDVMFLFPDIVKGYSCSVALDSFDEKSNF